MVGPPSRVRECRHRHDWKGSPSAPRARRLPAFAFYCEPKRDLGMTTSARHKWLSKLIDPATTSSPTAWQAPSLRPQTTKRNRHQIDTRSTLEPWIGSRKITHHILRDTKTLNTIGINGGQG